MSKERCVTCRVGRLAPGRATLIFDHDQGLAVVIRRVPAEVCDCCGDAMVDEETARTVLAMAARPPARGVVVLDYAAWMRPLPELTQGPPNGQIPSW